MIIVKEIRGRIPDWYRRRLVSSLYCFNSDHFREHLPYDLQIQGFTGDQTELGWLLKITAAPVTIDRTQVRSLVIGEFPDGSTKTETTSHELYRAVNFKTWLGLK